MPATAKIASVSNDVTRVMTVKAKLGGNMNDHAAIK
jgi:hypothetical protein